LQNLNLATSGDTSANGTGTIDFSRNLDLRFQVRSAQPESKETAGATFRLTGPLAAPKVVLPPQPPLRRSR
jgi:hypothetical protein